MPAEGAYEVLLRLVTDLDAKGIQALISELEKLKKTTGSYSEAVINVAAQREILTKGEAEAATTAGFTAAEEAQLTTKLGALEQGAKGAGGVLSSLTKTMSAFAVVTGAGRGGVVGFAVDIGQLLKRLSGWQVAAVAVGAAVAAAIRSTVSWGREVYKFSLATGLAVEEAAALAAVSQRAGVELSAWTRPITMVNTELLKMQRSEENVKTITDGVGKVLGYTSTDMARYGVTLKDATGATLPFLDILRQMRDRYQEIAPGLERTSYMSEVFGYASANLAPIFNLTNTEFERFLADAEKWGLTQAKTVAATRQFDFALKGLQEVLRGLAVRIGTGILPVLTLLAKGFTVVVEAIHEALPSIADFLKRRIPALGGVFEWLGARLAVPEIPVGAGLAEIGAALSAKAAEAAEAAVKEIQKRIKAARKAYEREKKVWQDRVDAARVLVDIAQEGVDAQKDALEKLQEAIDTEVKRRLELMGIILDPARMEALKDAVADAKDQTQDAEDALDKARKSRAKYGSVLLTWEEINAQSMVEMAEAEQKRAEKALRTEERKQRVADAVKREVEATYAGEKAALEEGLKIAQKKLEAAQAFLKSEQAALRQWELTVGAAHEAYIENLENDLEAAQERAEQARLAAEEAEKLAKAWEEGAISSGEAAGRSISAIAQIKEWWGNIVKLWNSFLKEHPALASFIDYEVAVIKNFIRVIKDRWTDIKTWWANHKEDIQGAATFWAGWVTDVKNNIINGIRTTWNTLKTYWQAHQSDTGSLKDTIGLIVTDIKDKIILKIQEHFGTIRGWFEVLKSWAEWLGGRFGETVGKCIEAISKISGFISDIESWIAGLKNALKNALRQRTEEEATQPPVPTPPVAPTPPEVTPPGPYVPPTPPGPGEWPPWLREKGGVIPATGWYLLHKRELVIPAPKVSIPWSSALAGLSRVGVAGPGAVKLEPQFNFDFHVRTKEPVEVGLVNRDLGLDMWHTYS